MDSVMRKNKVIRWKKQVIWGEKQKNWENQKFFQKKLAFAAPPCYNKQALRSADNTKQNMGVFPSGQRGQTVNLLGLRSVGRIHRLQPVEILYTQMRSLGFSFAVSCFAQIY